MTTTRRIFSTKQQEFVVFHWIRTQIEIYHTNFNVPISLKYLIQQFAEKCIASNILTIKQDLILIDVLITKKLIQYTDNYCNFKLLYRASENNFKCLKFHTSFDNETINKSLGNITIVETKYKNIFVGYASQSWNKGESHGWIKDEQAFLSLIRSNKHEVQSKLPLIFDLKPGHEEHALYCHYSFGPIFGKSDIHINNDCNQKQKQGESFHSVNASTLLSYYNEQIENFQWINQLTILGGGTKPHGGFDVKEYELFSINI